MIAAASVVQEEMGFIAHARPRVDDECYWRGAAVRIDLAKRQLPYLAVYDSRLSRSDMHCEGGRKTVSQKEKLGVGAGVMRTSSESMGSLPRTAFCVPTQTTPVTHADVTNMQPCHARTNL